jgi:protease II
MIRTSAWDKDALIAALQHNRAYQEQLRMHVEKLKESLIKNQADRVRVVDIGDAS